MTGRLKKLFLFVILAAFSLLSSIPASGNSDAHLVQINVEPVTVLSIAGNSNLNETSVIVDAKGVTTEGKQLKWTTNQRGLKITVQSDLLVENQNYRLQIKAVKLDSHAKSNGWVAVTERPASIINDISTEFGNCSIKYKASKRTDKNLHSDHHTILYTITE